MAPAEAVLFHVQPVEPLQGGMAGDNKEAAVKPAGDSIVVQVLAEDLIIFGKDSAACARKISLATASASLLPGSDLVLCIDVSADSETLEVMQVLQQPQDEGPAASEALLLQCASHDDAEALLASLQRAGCAMRGLLQRYDLLQEVGFGAFGRVMKAEDKLTGRTVAVKLFTRSTPLHLHPLRESTLLRRASHPAFVAFEGVYQVSEPELLSLVNFEGDSTWAIVTEFVDGIELFDFLSRRKLDEYSVRKMARKLFSGLCWLHERGIIHRDVKPENVMITSDGDARLLDFGIATPTSDSEALSRASGSLGHVAPEIMRRKLATSKSDCFSMGTLLFGALCGVKPFTGANTQEVTHKNYKSKYSKRLLRGLSPDAVDLLTKLLEKRPSRRPSARESLQHPWLREPGQCSPPLPQGPRQRPARPGSAVVCRSKDKDAGKREPSSTCTQSQAVGEAAFARRGRQEWFNSVDTKDTKSTAATAEGDIDESSEHSSEGGESSSRKLRARGSGVTAVRSLRVPSPTEAAAAQESPKQKTRLKWMPWQSFGGCREQATALVQGFHQVIPQQRLQDHTFID